MRINHKILSLPPYISTSWKNVISLHVEYRTSLPLLTIGLLNGQCIEVPNLELPIIDAIFQAHAKSMDQESSILQRPAPRESEAEMPSLMEQLSLSFPIKISSMNLDNLGPLLQHNPQQADAPPLPADILNKIASLSKTAGIEEDLVPDAEPHCNCIHCQISRAVKGETKEVEEEHPLCIDEEVSDEDLKFRIWDIQQTSPNLFNVTNPLDEKESYSVFLGDPVGCTCGQKTCEHVVAVLKS
ncbi:MAG: hypothetical protein HYX48_06885 [Chlamydiales bacterium]|nr:hypothetical protein [Chlamydiales bacterium]